VSHSSSGYRRVPLLRKSSTVWIWQHDKRADDNKMVLNCARKLLKNELEKEVGKCSNLTKMLLPAQIY
jgi:hypothetical protein